jgi:hypothetical protein
VGHVGGSVGGGGDFDEAVRHEALDEAVLCEGERVHRARRGRGRQLGLWRGGARGELDHDLGGLGADVQIVDDELGVRGHLLSEQLRARVVRRAQAARHVRGDVAERPRGVELRGDMAREADDRDRQNETTSDRGLRVCRCSAALAWQGLGLGLGLGSGEVVLAW